MANLRPQGGRKLRRYSKWALEHLVFPAVVVLIGILINNYLEARKRPDLTHSTGLHQVAKLSDDKFVVQCPFRFYNNGGSSTKGRKATLWIPKTEVIKDISISAQYSSFYSQVGGGKGFHFVVYSFDLPRGSELQGILSFESVVNLPRNAPCPLQIRY
jgi:hypothetical protein